MFVTFTEHNQDAIPFNNHDCLVNQINKHIYYFKIFFIFNTKYILYLTILIIYFS